MENRKRNVTALGLMVLSSFGVYVFFKKSGWL